MIFSRGPRLFPLCSVLLCAGLVCGCSLTNPSAFISDESYRQNILSDSTLRLNSVAGPLDAAEALIVADARTSFSKRLLLLRNSSESVDLALHRMGSDAAGFALARELLAAAARGVRVRLLLDYFENYPDLDLLLMLEKFSEGRLEIRLLNRPADAVLKQAAITAAVSAARDAKRSAAQADQARSKIEQALSAERKRQKLPALVPSNYDSGGSGLLVSAVYGRDPVLLASALKQQEPFALSALPKLKSSTALQPEQAAQLGERAAAMEAALRSNDVSAQARQLERRFSPLQTLMDSKPSSPLQSLMPPQDADEEAAALWKHRFSGLNHNTLLVDEREIVIGSHRTEQNEVRDVSADVFIRLRSQTPGIKRSFDRLWDSQLLSASLSDAREHSAHEFSAAFRSAQGRCRAEAPEAAKACVRESFAAELAEEKRLKEKNQNMRDAAEKNAAADPGGCTGRCIGAHCGSGGFSFDETPAPAAAGGKKNSAERVARAKSRLEQLRSSLVAEIKQRRACAKPLSAQSLLAEVDPLARIYPLHNVPFQARSKKRIIGGEIEREGESGKHIHAVWLAGLRNACTRGNSPKRTEVIIHSAHFFPPANLLRQLAQMVNGEIECRNVAVTILTNSPQNTAQPSVLLGRFAMKALFDYYKEHGDKERGAELRLYEYAGADAPLGAGSVSILGDDILVSGTDANVRGFMADTGSAVLIRSAPQLLERTTRWLHSLLDDALLASQADAALTKSSVEQLLKQYSAPAAKAAAASLPLCAAEPECAQEAANELLKAAREAYNLARETLRRRSWFSSTAEEYDARFAAF